MTDERAIEKIKDIILSGYLPVIHPQKYDDLLIIRLRNSAQRLVEAGYADKQEVRRQTCEEIYAWLREHSYSEEERTLTNLFHEIFIGEPAK